VTKHSSDDFVVLRERSTGNHALDKDAYGPMPHLFFNLALKYPVPPDFLLTVFFLWDKTVGQDADRDIAAGDCALSQIPVRPRARNRWLAALAAAGFWTVKKAKSGGANQRGSFYIYENPTAAEWGVLFKAASMVQHFRGWDRSTTPERFGKVFARALGRLPAVQQTDDPEPTPAERAAAFQRLKPSETQATASDNPKSKSVGAQGT